MCCCGMSTATIPASGRVRRRSRSTSAGVLGNSRHISQTHLVLSHIRTTDRAGIPGEGTISHNKALCTFDWTWHLLCTVGSWRVWR